MTCGPGTATAALVPRLREIRCWGRKPLAKLAHFGNFAGRFLVPPASNDQIITLDEFAEPEVLSFPPNTKPSVAVFGRREPQHNRIVKLACSK
jgi:hypothetical protein